MQEKRKFFRINNSGQFQARFDNHALDIFNISASSVAIRPKVYLPMTGTLELQIHYVLIKVNYHLLRMSNEDMILVFKDDEQVESLLSLLKWLKYQPH
ncbi:MAG: hypothetical protein PSV35_09675 [bacterium]|nr:hypothetical protein [bacterium]